VLTDTSGLRLSRNRSTLNGLICVLLFIIHLYIDHKFIVGLLQTWCYSNDKLWKLKATCSWTVSCFCWVSLRPMLYLLSTICAHFCYLHIHQDGQMNRIGKRINAMNIRLDVNESTYMWLESPRERVIFLFPLHLCKDYVLIVVMYKQCDDTFPSFVDLCVIDLWAHVRLCIPFYP
jgi:hypothetical protein